MGITSKISVCSFGLALILILSGFTHIWNPTGFPGLHPDEGHYMRRAMLVLEGLGPHDTIKNDNIALLDTPYDHPYFGQLFLAALLGMMNYPALLNPSSHTLSDAVQSVEMSYLFPRVLMGILAVIDTFLIYNISSRRYNRNIALIASALFAVMPLTLMLRRIYLDSILLPFLLSSILFALYASDFRNNSNDNNRQIRALRSTNCFRKNILIMLSGLFLGLAIFTKIPAFTMIPVVGLLIYTSSKDRRLKKLALWFIPVILIPSIWPAVAIMTGEFDLWVDGIFWQLNRVEETHFDDAINAFFTIDPVLLVIGTAGLVFAAVKRDLWLLLWVIPFLVFSFIVEWVIVFHLTVLVPPLCIAAATLIQTLSMKVTKKRVQRLLPYAVISGIGIFGLISSINLITLSLNTAHIEANALFVKELSSVSNVTDHNQNNTIVFGHRIYLWIPKFVYHIDFDYQVLTTNHRKIIWIADHPPRDEQLLKIYDSTREIAEFEENLSNHDRHIYPFNTLRWFKFTLGNDVGLRTNY